MPLETPPSTICPELTQAQAKRLHALKRSGHNVVAYEAIVGDRISAVVFVTTRTQFAIGDDGTILDLDQLEADGTLPARSSSGRRRSLRENPDDNTTGVS